MITRPTQIVNYLTPSLRYGVGGFDTTIFTLTITPATPPLKGSLLLIFMAGGTTTQSPETTPPGFTWYTSVASSWGLQLYAKVSDGTETSFTFTYNPSRSPAWFYHEWLNLELNGAVIVQPASGLQGPNTSPWTTPSFNVPVKGVTFYCGAKNETSLITAGAPWNTISASGQQKSAWQIFNDFAAAQTITWTKSGGGTFSFNTMIVSFHAKKVRI